MNTVTARIAQLLELSAKDLSIVEDDTEGIYLVVTSDLESYVYSEKEDKIKNITKLHVNEETLECSPNYFTPEEKEEIYLNNKGLIGFALKKINRLDGIEREELEDVCNLGFAKALASFNKNFGIQFSTYCVRCMINEMFYYLRKEQKKVLTNVSMEKPLASDGEGNDFIVLDTITNDSLYFGKSLEEIALLKELRITLLDSLDFLNDDERYLITYRYGLDRGIVLTQKIIAEKLGMSQANISKLEKTCLKKLRLALKKKKYVYDAKTKTISMSDDIQIYGADEKVNLINADDELNITLIAAEKLRINLEEIKDVFPTSSKNDFIVTFDKNTRIYARVNVISEEVSLGVFDLSNEEKFLIALLDIPRLGVPTRNDIEKTDYNVKEYSLEDLKHVIDELEDKEKDILLKSYGLFGEKTVLTSQLAENYGINSREVIKMRREAFLKTAKKYFNYF